MQKATKRLVLAVATHPSTVKVCARYAFRLVRLLGRAAEQTPGARALARPRGARSVDRVRQGDPAMIATGIVVFLSVALILVKLPRRLMLRACAMMWRLTLL